MKRLGRTLLAVVALTAAASSNAHAQGAAQPGPWTMYGSSLIATGSDVWVKFYGADAGYTNSLFYLCTASCDQFLFQNNNTAITQPGQEVKLNGTFAAGQEVIFRLFVQTTGDNWYSGAASRNADNYAHFATQMFNDVTSLATYTVLGGFEDLRGGGDQDRNDLMFEISGVSAVTATPEPATLSLLATGLLGIGGMAYRRRRAATNS
jgi:hypothetical protein